MIYVFTHKNKPGIKVYLDAKNKGEAFKRLKEVASHMDEKLSKSGWYEVKEEN